MCEAPQSVLIAPRIRQIDTRLGGQDTAYHFRYIGLRLLVYAQGRWFLLPAGWTATNGSTVIVLDDDPGHVRVDLAPSFG